MKKILFILLVSIYCVGCTQNINKFHNIDEKNIASMVYGLRSLYITQASFHNLEQLPLKNIIYDYGFINDNDLNKFKLVTDNDDKVAVIQYNVADCNHLKYIKKKLVTASIILPSEYATCVKDKVVIKINIID